FDRHVPQVLFDVLGQLGRGEERDRLARSRRALAKAAPQLVPSEHWFAVTNPAPTAPSFKPPATVKSAPNPELSSKTPNLASIVVLCCNELAYTKQCFDSVIRHTHTPYELIMIDNGSTDETLAYLTKFSTRTGPRHITLIHNDTNLGFTRGCNQGIAHSQGQYVVLLNNDTIVSPNWLSDLIQGLEAAGPKAGMIGPVSNATAAPQQIAIDYTEISRVDEFAARRRREHGLPTRTVDRLAGFCLVIRRSVLDRIGSLDERFGVGFFDDFDLCVRTREAGFDLLLAPGVFVHHFLNRTFVGQKIDIPKQFQANFERFVEKWGRERVERYLPDMKDRLALMSPPLKSPVPQVQSRQRVSLCMIVRNEEKNLQACLAGAADLVDEVIVVDTGSTDRTKDIATQAGAKVFDFPWVDSFAAARNESLRHATGDWIFWLDADDRIDEPTQVALRSLFASLSAEPAVYLLPTSIRHGAHASFVDHARLFRNHPSVRWEYRVHEQILGAAQRAGWPVRRTKIVIRHEGYVDPAGLQAKSARNLRLLQQEQAERPNDPLILFNLGSMALDRGDATSAIPLLEQSLQVSPPGYSLVCKTYTLLVCAHRQLGRTVEAMQICRVARSKLPNEPELLFYEGLLLQESGQPVAAESCLRTLLQLPAPSDLSGNDVGLQGYKTRHNLAVTLRDQKRGSEAEVEWRRVVEEQPDFAPAWLGLASLLASQGRWDDLERDAQQIETHPHAREMATLLRAKVFLDRKNPEPAVPLLEAVKERLPYAVWPHLLLAEARWQLDKNSAATKQALQDVLKLDPNHLPTHKRLEQLHTAEARSESQTPERSAVSAGRSEA
ncbi:MAG: glycosyltransferase, partial [Planctomycetes bacterium]|nr:glycosyltransferase [Planctomycetota bacterium]